MSQRNRVAITGLGVLADNGIGLETFWSTLVQGKSGIGPITLFDASDLPCRIAGEVTGFNPEEFIDPSKKPRRRMARFTQLGMAAAKMAIDDAGLDVDFLAGLTDLAVVMGVSTNAQDLREKKPGIFTAVAGIPSAAASAIGYSYNENPQLLTLSDGCASSLDAIGAAADLIRSGRAEVVIAGGAEGSINRYVVQILLKCRRCSTRNDEPEKASCPFDRHRDYGVIAEGSGVVVLESVAHARARGAQIYGEIAGYGCCSDPASGVEGSGLGQAMELALVKAEVSKDQVDHVNAHGPSDIDMDVVESEAIRRIFGGRADRIPVISIKGATGCAMGAGGVLQVVSACLSLKKGIIPPTTNYRTPDLKCDLDYVPEGARSANLSSVLVNTHGFGRSNGSMLLRKVSA